MASFCAGGAIAVITYASKIAYVPSHIFAMSVLRMAIPKLAKYHTDGLHKEIKRYVYKILITILAVAVPLAVIFAWRRAEIIQLIYGHGKFSTEDLQDISRVFAVYSLAMPLTCMCGLYQALFCSMSAYHYPIRVGIVQTLTFALSASFFIQSLGTLGIAVGFLMGQSAAAMCWLLISKKAIFNNRSITDQYVPAH